MSEVNFETMSVSEIGEHACSLERADLKALCEKLSIKHLQKLIMGMASTFDFESNKFIEKQNKSAGLRSRKVTANLQTVFLEWRRKSIEASSKPEMLS